jgi:hypothetical protein
MSLMKHTGQARNAILREHTTVGSARQAVGGSGQKGSRSLRASGLGLWQQAVEFGGFGSHSVSQMVAQLARGLHRGT